LSRGALNAGLAWILGGRAVDGFGQNPSSSFLGFVLSRAFLFYRSPGDLRANAGTSRKVPFNFYNLANIAPAGLLGREGREGNEADGFYSIGQLGMALSISFISRMVSARATTTF